MEIDTTAILSTMQANADPLAKNIPMADTATGRVDKVAQDFEAVFLSEMLQHMFEGVDFGGLSGNPESQEVYRTWLVDEYGRIMARAGGIGLAEPVRNELLHLQEISHART